MSACPHTLRRFHLRDSGVVVWHCRGCDAWGYAVDLAAFDAQLAAALQTARRQRV